MSLQRGERDGVRVLRTPTGPATGAGRGADGRGMGLQRRWQRTCVAIAILG